MSEKCVSWDPSLLLGIVFQQNSNLSLSVSECQSLARYLIRDSQQCTCLCSFGATCIICNFWFCRPCHSFWNICQDFCSYNLQFLILLPLSQLADTFWNICQDFCWSASSDSRAVLMDVKIARNLLLHLWGFGFRQNFPIGRFKWHWISLYSSFLPCWLGEEGRLLHAILLFSINSSLWKRPYVVFNLENWTSSAKQRTNWRLPIVQIARDDQLPWSKQWTYCLLIL